VKHEHESTSLVVSQANWDRVYLFALLIASFAPSNVATIMLVSSAHRSRARTILRLLRNTSQ
jgi:hypothetical protein